MTKRFLVALLSATVLAGSWVLPGTALAQDASDCIKIDGSDRCLPIAPDSDRVDLVEPSFSDPTTITNPLFPISNLHSVLLLGYVDRAPLRIEVTLLPETKTIDWNGQQTETLVSQFVAFRDGQILEVALDWYAQADDGAVWYFGEDVFNYEDGVVADTEGTWLAGKDGPPAMIMPAAPAVGDVYRPENMPGFVFEEVTVTTVGETMHGPQGPVAGAIVAQELHQDGTYEDKIFAPGYGEFRSSSGVDLEALALAVPTDALSGPPAAEVETLTTGAAGIFTAVESEDWEAVAAAEREMSAAWAAYRADDVPDLLEYQMSEALNTLAGAVDARDPAEIRQVAMTVEQAGLDLQLRHREPSEIDLARFDLRARQLLINAEADDPAAVTGDVAALEWIWDRVAHTFDASTAKQIDALLGDLRTAADAEDLAAATDAATELRDLLTAGATGVSAFSAQPVAADEDGNRGAEDETAVASGTLDDGEELLPQAEITLAQPVEVAQTAASGPVGEVDLEYDDGRLVFNVDIGDRDVKVDAADGRVLAAVADD